MPYSLIEFDGVPLPRRMPEDDLSTGASDSSLLDSVGGAFDYWGARQRLPRKRTIPYRGIYLGETSYITDGAGNYLVDGAGNRIIAGDAEAMLRSQVDTLRAQRGMRGALWRERDSDGARQWLTARLLSITQKRTIDDAGIVATVECQFETLHPSWRAATATSVTASASAATPTGLLAQNGGDVTVEDAVLSVARTSGTITQVAVVGPGVAWTWAGSIGAGQTLTIDCGAQTMRRGTTDVYSGWVRGAAHTAAGWLPLAEGDNVFVVTLTGGAGNVTIQHYNQWG